MNGKTNATLPELQTRNLGRTAPGEARNSNILRKNPDQQQANLLKTTDARPTNPKRDRPELPNLLNKSFNAPAGPSDKSGKLEEQRKADLSMDAKLAQPKYQRTDTHNSNLTKGIDGVSRIYDHNPDPPAAPELPKASKPRQLEALQLDKKLELWSSIINERKKLYKKMVQEINTGNAEGFEGDEEEAERFRRIAKQKEKQKAASKSKDKGLLLESRLEINIVGNKEALTSITVEQVRTPEDLLNDQIQDIFNEVTHPYNQSIELRNLQNYLIAFENAPKKR